VNDSLRTLVYAAVLGAVCASLLTGAATFTEPYKKSNARAEEMRNILGVLDVPHDPHASSRELVEVFEKNVRVAQRGELATYVYRSAGSPAAAQVVAIPFAGPGLWGPIKGLLSLDAEMKTIRGITFYEQEETPGLGGDIGSPWFRGQFKGKRIEDAAGRPGIRIRRDGVVGLNEVDAITGATMTCEKVEDMLNRAIERITEARTRHGR